MPNHSKKAIPYSTLSEFNEIWHTCWFCPQTSKNLKFFIDQMIGFRDIAGYFFENFEKIRGAPNFKSPYLLN